MGGTQMKKLLLATTILGLSTPVMAADMPVKAPPPVVEAVFSWTGCYIGGNVGIGRARKENIDLFNPARPDSLGTHKATGLVGGGQLGCDYQVGRFVLGVQGMLDGASIRGVNVIPQNAAVSYNTRVSGIATLTGRAGIAFNRTLVYVKGGGAWVRERHQQLVNGVLFGNNSENQTWNGWTFGGGAEFAFTGNWSVFGEYNYLGFKNDRTCFVVGGCTAVSQGINQKFNVQTILFGLNYRFGGGAVVARY